MAMMNTEEELFGRSKRARKEQLESMKDTMRLSLCDQALSCVIRDRFKTTLDAVRKESAVAQAVVDRGAADAAERERKHSRIKPLFLDIYHPNPEFANRQMWYAVEWAMFGKQTLRDRIIREGTFWEPEEQLCSGMFPLRLRSGTITTLSQDGKKTTSIHSGLFAGASQLIKGKKTLISPTLTHVQEGTFGPRVGDHPPQARHVAHPVLGIQELRWCLREGKQTWIYADGSVKTIEGSFDDEGELVNSKK